MNVYDFSVEDADGVKTSLRSFEGKVLLIINSATKCGFTPQYDALQDLYEKYADEGFVILDFPCNQFHEQAPEETKDIVKFCDSNFGITFPIFNKLEVKGETAHPLFKYLTFKKGFGGFDAAHKLTPVLQEMLSKEDPDYEKKPDIKWNFTKFLISRKGNVVTRFEPTDDFYLIDEAVANELAVKDITTTSHA